MGVVRGAVEWLLSVPAPLALALVFLLPALETSALLGVVVPGELAIVVGGVAASLACSRIMMLV